MSVPKMLALAAYLVLERQWIGMLVMLSRFCDFVFSLHTHGVIVMWNRTRPFPLSFTFHHICMSSHSTLDSFSHQITHNQSMLLASLLCILAWKLTVFSFISFFHSVQIYSRPASLIGPWPLCSLSFLSLFMDSPHS